MDKNIRKNYEEEKEENNENLNKKKQLLLYGKKYLEERGVDDYSKIELLVKGLSKKSLKNKNQFVPKPKPLEINFVPSKLKLCPIIHKKYSNSCPNSDSSSDCFSDEENCLKDLRKKLNFLKYSVPKTFSKVIVNKKKLFDIENEELKFNDKEDIYSGSDNDYEIDNNEKRQIRLNSCSILEILQNKI
jgi:hypothetical protein